MNHRSPLASVGSTAMAVVLLLATAPVWTATGSLVGQATYPDTPPSSPPEDWGAVSINMEDVPYPYPVETMGLSLFGKDLRMAYMDVAPAGPANGQTVVLLHGASYYGMYWEETMEALRQAGFRVVVPDQLGWGRSSKAIIPYSLNLHAANTQRLLEHLGVEEAAVVGHSMGGMLATRFAFMYPETTTHVVMVNQIGLVDNRKGRDWTDPTPHVGDEDLQAYYETRLALEERRVVEWKPEFLEHVRIDWGWRLSAEWPRLAMVRALNTSARNIDTVVYDWPQIETKALVIAGEEDGPDFPELARNVAESFPNAELVLFPDVGHTPHLEAPELFIPELILFLESDPAAPASTDWR